MIMTLITWFMTLIHVTGNGFVQVYDLAWHFWPFTIALILLIVVTAIILDDDPAQ